jgi:pimeloyl-ACP methyl ester carboxylesterase
MRREPGHGDRLSYYDFGRTTVYASTHDPRFSYCLYVPDNYEEIGSRHYDLLVAVHGTARDIAGCREQFVQLAERHDLIVLAPLFPGGISKPMELSSYKMLRADEYRYDVALLAMIDEIAGRYRIRSDRFSLQGFSGGGHFAHRFLYLHPERLSAVSIGAPGIVTLLDFDRDFWVGVRNFEHCFGKPIDLAAMREVAVQMVIGADDTDTWEITIQPQSALWAPGCEQTGANRLERLASLKSSFQHCGIAVRHDVVPGVAHRMAGLAPAINAFFDTLYTQRKAGPSPECRAVGT